MFGKIKSVIADMLCKLRNVKESTETAETVETVKTQKIIDFADVAAKTRAQYDKMYDYLHASDEFISDWLFPEAETDEQTIAEINKLTQLAERFFVTVTVRRLIGPAGGSPELILTGERRYLRAFLLAEYTLGEVNTLNGIASLMEDADEPY